MLKTRRASAFWTNCRGLMADAGVGVAVVHVGDDKHLDEQLGCIPSEEGAELRIVL